MVRCWWEIQVLADAALEETLFWRLQSVGSQGTSSQSQGQLRLVQAYFHQEQEPEIAFPELEPLLQQDALNMGLPLPQIKWQLIEEEDWATSWKAHWHPQEIGERFLIYPAWLPVPEHCDRVLLRLDPGVAFGTGAHATTQLCLEAITRQLSQTSVLAEDLVVADVGCGTGILAIGAILLGAQQAFAVDTDPLAVDAACKSRDLNQVDPARMAVALGSVAELSELLPQPVDGIFCNILAEVVKELIPQMTQISKPTTWAIISGVLQKQAPDVIACCQQHGWTVAGKWQQQDWCCIQVQRT